MDVFPESWPLRQLVADGVLAGPPHHGIGRGFKVAREEIVALLVALRCFVVGDYQRADIPRYHEYLCRAAAGLVDLEGVQTLLRGSLDEDRFPTLEVQLASRQSAFEVHAA